jgi:hypothetical protein
MASNPILITGGVICLFSASLLLVAGAFTNEGVKEMEDLEEIDYDASDYYFETMETETHHVGFVQFVDEDGAGSLPWMLMVEGQYSDANEDGQIDVCEGLRMEILWPGVNNTRGWVNVTDENVGTLKCDMSNQVRDPEDDDLVTIGYICDTIGEPAQNCTVGQSFWVTLYDEDNSSIPFTLYDSDASTIAFFQIVGEDAAEAIAPLLGAGLIGFVSCCGMVFGFIIFLVGLLTGGNPPQEVQFVYQSPNPMAMNSDVNGSIESQPKLKDQAIGESSESKDGEWWDEIVKDE